MSAEKLLPSVEAGEMSRPGFLQRAANIGSVALLGLALDRLSGELWWPENSFGFEYQSPEIAKKATRLTVVVPGLGTQSAKRIADALTPSLEADGHTAVAYLRLPERAPSGPAIGQAFHDLVAERRHQGQCERLGFFCHSMGGPTAVRLLPYLPEGMRVDWMALDCSPTSIDDTWGNPRLLRTLSFLGYPGGLISKALTAALSYRPHPDHANQVSFHDRWRELRKASGPESGSVMTWIWQMQLLCHTAPRDMQKVLSRHLAPNARLCYLQPDPPSRDKVVRVTKAHASWQQITGRQVDLLPIPGASHAWPTEYATHYNQALQNWLLADETKD